MKSTRLSNAAWRARFVTLNDFRRLTFDLRHRVEDRADRLEDVLDDIEMCESINESLADRLVTNVLERA